MDYEWNTVTLVSFLNGVAHCTFKHVTTEEYITPKGKIRTKMSTETVFDGNVHYSPPHPKVETIDITFPTRGDALTFVDSLKASPSCG